MIEVGGGGGIAWIDEVGALKVGPQSAGASPDPVCYGAGGFGNLMFMAQAGHMKNDETIRGLKLFAEELLPRLKELKAGSVAA